MEKNKNSLFNSETTLIILLLTKPVLLFFDSCPKEFIIGKTKYTDMFDSDWTGFYDWQRDSNKKIFAITHFTFDDCQEFIKNAKLLLQSSHHIIITDAPSIDIHFWDNPPQIVDTSGDQLFGNNRIYKSNQGTYAISFGLNCLTLSDLKALKESPFLNKSIFK